MAPLGGIILGAQSAGKDVKQTAGPPLPGHADVGLKRLAGGFQERRESLTLNTESRLRQADTQLGGRRVLARREQGPGQNGRCAGARGPREAAVCFSTHLRVPRVWTAGTFASAAGRGGSRR